MDTQQVANALLLLPAAVFGIVAIRARRRGRTLLGLGLRDGAALDALRGVALGFSVSGYLLADPVVTLEVTGPDALTGGTYGPEGGVVGIAVRVLMIVLLLTWVRGRVPAWTVRPPTARTDPAGPTTGPAAGA